MIDKVADRIARVIVLTLAVAFLVAVTLNFSNVLGRYLLGISFLGSDEIQVFIMVGMTFLGAAVVLRSNQHLRMDVLVTMMPPMVQAVLRIVEQLLLVTLTGFVTIQSYSYATQMFQLGRTSDMAGVPMWIPHGMISVAFGLMFIISFWRVVTLISRRTIPCAGSGDA